MFTQIIKFTVKPQYQQSFKDALITNKNGTRKEKGNTDMAIFVDNTNPNIFFAYERWQDATAFEFHKNQAYTQDFITLLDDTLATAPQVYKVNDTKPYPVAMTPANPEDDIFSIFFIFPIHSEFRQPLLTQFEDHIQHTRQENGNLLFDLYTVQDDDNTLVVYEHWRKESDVWDIHFNQPYAKITGAIMEQAVVGDMQQYMHFVSEINE
ncbi:putative quinol monooxygenase [Shewanella livingstonensis]|uniref:Antibiotic biosynthesis monooxygenase n=1 Tax=Shewanella livingstonensis TaxID=150120 RepID=A0A3G8LXR4_9GAMM|nr:antibiotic biosynthesis monooxygenase [Shewanella livingstonensis]AZG73498.1 antibiotic biosynthesis monooxygenase [Shewanella livingstonensis]